MNPKIQRNLILAVALAAIKVRRLFETPPRVQLANIAEGQSSSGNKSYLPDAAIALRYTLVKFGSDQSHIVAGSNNTEIPLGVATDSADAANLDVPVNVALLGSASGTLKAQCGGTVNYGDFLQSKGDGTVQALLATTGTFYRIGRALQSGVAGDVIEFSSENPIKIVNP